MGERRLFIAEKPSLAQAIADGMGGGQKAGTHIKVGNDIVTWCRGHILELAEPDEYLSDAVPKNSKGKKVWRMEDLAIIPKKWKTLPVAESHDQLKAIRSLLKDATIIVNAGDPDREGQLLVDEVLEFCGLDPDGKKVERVLISAMDAVSVEKALRSVKPNHMYRPLRLCALGRQRADWLMGMNGTRAFTCKYNSLITVGRVQTPTLALVVARDLEIENFKPRDFYTPMITLADGTQMKWCGRTVDTPGIDEEGRIVDRKLGEAIVRRIEDGLKGQITLADAEEKAEKAPLPHSLDTLSIELSKKTGMSAQRVLDACQGLYETHKLTTYPRTDCRYLPESQIEDKGRVLQALHGTSLRNLVEGADTSLRSRAWNDSKVTAHHAIIPTGVSPTGKHLTGDERIVFDTVSRYYISQFYPDHLYLDLQVEALFGEDKFRSARKESLAPGWKVVLGGDKNDDGGGADAAAAKARPGLRNN